MSVKSSFLTIFRSVKKEKQKPTLGNVYRWASHLTAETRWVFEDYYWSNSAKKLLFKLRNIEQGLIGVIGLQGTGKTTTLQVLASHVHTKEKPAVFIRWTADWFEQFSKENSRVNKEYRLGVFDKAYDKAEAYARQHKSLFGRVPDRNTLAALELGQKGYMTRDATSLQEAELMLGKRECKEEMEKAVYWTLSEARYLLIDLPDYSKGSRKDMVRDLRDVEVLWKKLQQAPYELTNQIFVVGCQKELFKGHFFFGKMDVVEIEALKPEELIEAYKKKWEDVKPFTEDALLLIAQLSRGVFRRFLKYIQLSIERHVTTKKKEEYEEMPIDSKLVSSTVGVEQLAKDMDLELSEVFKEKHKKLQAVKLLNFIRQVKEPSQKQIAEELNISEMSVGRLVRKLEAYGYVMRKRGERGAWLISLKQVSG